MKHTTPRIKICGIKCPDMAYNAAQLGAHYIGIMFHRSSKRYVEIHTAKSIVAAIKKAGAIPVAVFTNHTAPQMIQVCEELAISTVQLHSATSREQHIHLPQHISRIYVLHVDETGSITNLADESFTHLIHNRDYLLFDGLEGGSGETIITSNLPTAAGEFNYFIAGGLNEQNVTKIIANCTPYAVDISSGVENKLGEKDLNLIDHFINKVKSQELSHE